MERLEEQIKLARREIEKLPIWFQNDMELKKTSSSKTAKREFSHSQGEVRGNGKYMGGNGKKI